jgi:hypothetical protein
LEVFSVAVPYHVRYARVTPTSRFGFVEMSCEVQGQNSRATVTYTFTPLTEAGNAYLESFSKDDYQQMIDSWQTEINAYLEQAQK